MTIGPGDRIKDTEMEMMEKGILRQSQKLLPEYREKAVELVKKGGHKKKNARGNLCLSQQFEKSSYDSCMIAYYPCIFLANADLKKGDACMIYPFRPKICRNTDDFGTCC
jgi:Fe-S-cluster containining protein